MKNNCLYPDGFFKGLKLTVQDMNSIASFNKIVKNYLKMKKLEELNEKN